MRKPGTQEKSGRGSATCKRGDATGHKTTKRLYDWHCEERSPETISSEDFFVLQVVLLNLFSRLPGFLIENGGYFFTDTYSVFLCLSLRLLHAGNSG